MGVHDLPADIDWILNVTGHKKLYYIGHSMGTTMSYVMASMRPEYNDKVHFMVSLAPVAFMAKVKSPIRLLVPFIKDFEVNTDRQRTVFHPSYRISRLVRRALFRAKRLLNSSVKFDLPVLRHRLIFKDLLEKNASYATGNKIYTKPVVPINTFCESS